MLRNCTEPESPQVTVVVEGRAVAAGADESVASVLMRVFGVEYRSSAIDGSARAPYCMIGACFECLAQVDGIPNRQGCLVTVREGMTIARQNGRVGIE
ncbi:MAG: (2Fe-2S)-binding protein [Burkholderiaceae bacterium]|nr:(2Fe-2S)-binding protein [Burkholderiaceae bacterium]